MAGLVLSAGCALSQSLAIPTPNKRFISTSSSISTPTNISILLLLRSKHPIFFFPSNSHGWPLKLTSLPLTIPSLDEQQQQHLLNLQEDEEDEEIFDAGAPPPFKLGDIRAAIPKHCWVKDPWRSMSYVIRDVAIVLALAAAAAHLNNSLLWPLYWAAQGTMFWALFVLGHDCGHGSFSNNPKLNSVVGHLLHSSILVPYHGWRISHRTHHQNHGHVENDESWHPLTEKTFKSLDWMTRTLRFTLPFPMLAYPFTLCGIPKARKKEKNLVSSGKMIGMMMMSMMTSLCSS